MRFLIDAQLPPAVARLLVAQDHVAVHVFDLGMQSASDREIWDLAIAGRWIVVTKDEDFAQRKIMEPDGPAILWLRWPNTRRAELMTRFAVAIPKIVAAFEDDGSLVEMR